MVAIKDMKMPNECSVCPLYNGENTHCKGGCFIPYFFEDSENKRHSDCPLVEIGTCKDCTNYVIGALDEEICLRGHELIHKDFYCADFEKRGNENESIN